jgi:hypothetical protein
MEMRAPQLVVPAMIALASAFSAEAAQRTFVSTGGSDGNACSITAPCRSFGTALTHTDPGGEVIVLDSGAYGRVTISQSVTIEAPAGVYAGISVFAATNGIDVSAAGATITLRGLSINGQGGDVGINVTNVDALRIDRCRISGMGQQAIKIVAGNVVITHAYINDNGHDGIWANGLVDVLVRDTVSVNNLSGAAFFNGANGEVRDSSFTSNAFFGVYASGGPVATPTRVHLDNIEASNNVNRGVQLDGVVSGFASLTLTRSRIVGSILNGIVVFGASGPATLTVSDTTVSNGGGGYPAVAADGAGARLVAARNTVVDNASLGFYQVNSAVFESRGDNTVRNNNGGGVQTFGTITPIGGL